MYLNYQKPCVLFILCCVLQSGCSDPDSDNFMDKTKHQLIETEYVSNLNISIKKTMTSTLQPIRKIKIKNQVEGKLINFPFYPGDIVKKGQLLAHIEDSLLRSDVEKANAVLNQAKANYLRLKKLAQVKIIPEDKLSQAKTLNEIAISDLLIKQVKLSYSQIQSPISGMISQRLNEIDNVLPLYSHLLTLIDVSSLKIEIKLSELFLPFVKQDDHVDITVDVLGDKIFPAKIKRIYPTINKDTHQGTIEIILTHVPEGLLAGQFCRVSIYTKTQPRMMIPYSAVQHDKKGAYVFLVHENKAKRKNIITGILHEDMIEVLDGLIVNQKIISKGLFGLKDGIGVKVNKR